MSRETAVEREKDAPRWPADSFDSLPPFLPPFPSQRNQELTPLTCCSPAPPFGTSNPPSSEGGGGAAFLTDEAPALPALESPPCDAPAPPPPSRGTLEDRLTDDPVSAKGRADATGGEAEEEGRSTILREGERLHSNERERRGDGTREGEAIGDGREGFLFEADALRKSLLVVMRRGGQGWGLDRKEGCCRWGGEREGQGERRWEIASGRRALFLSTDFCSKADEAHMYKERRVCSCRKRVEKVFRERGA